MARTKYADKLADLERRITKLEQEVAALKAQFVEREKQQAWWKNRPLLTPEEDKAWEEIYEEGRKYRESLRPKARTPAKKKRTVKLAQAPRTSQAKLVTKRDRH